ncbi:MAG: ABC transporter permease [Planctomycetota bacterium]|jgi:lipopolysaccharide transport system permease protein|nr:ABC transporter permease [Planctomycetota bacterium]
MNGDSITSITPESALQRYWQRAWEHRDLLVCLSRRDLVVRYRQTAVGVAWLLIRPALMVAVFLVLFRQVAGMGAGVAGYTASVLIGVAMWQAVAGIVGQGALSLVNNPDLVTKVHFPRILLPLATVPPNVFDLGLTLLLVVPAAYLCDAAPSWRLLLLPFAVLPALAIAAGVTIWIAGAMVRWRDFRNIVPFLLQTGQLATPIGYPLEAVDEAHRVWFACNPLTAAVELPRWCLIAGYPLPAMEIMLPSMAIGLGLAWLGTVRFRLGERWYADVL